MESPLLPAAAAVGFATTDYVKGCIEGTTDDVWVAGEISNFARPASGHCFFTLKDDAAQLRAVVWRMTAARIPFNLHDGLQVACRGYLEVYAARGTYQLVIKQVLPQGRARSNWPCNNCGQAGSRGAVRSGRKRPLPRSRG